MKSYEKIVPDTSVIIGGVLSEKLGSEIKAEEIIIHNAVVAELEHQANKGRSTGFIGLDEIKKLREKTNVTFKGARPHAAEIRYASFGEIDSLIRQLAFDDDAVLVTADKVQHEVAESMGMKCLFLKPLYKEKKLMLDRYFDEITMSVHLKEGVFPFAKKGRPGAWEFVQLEDKIITQELLKEISSEVIEETKRRKDSYLEIERPSSTIVQLGLFRIVITRPPFSDGWEITAVRPVKKLNLAEYNLSPKLLDRVERQAEGILIAGAPGHGKSTFASALAIFYAEKNKIVKTIEAPRDLVLPESITQLALSHGTQQEIHDILLLSRPDYSVFDEMRNTADFNLFSDLRLAGIGLAGVIHATQPIDAIQRFVGKIELGVIPHVIDTVIFIKDGAVASVLNLGMTVKVPSGMTEADLARPVIVVNDFESGKLMFEIYSYGEETVVVPVSSEAFVSPTIKLAEKQLQSEMENYAPNVKVRLLSGNKAEVFVPENAIAKIIGKGGSHIDKIERELGLSIDVKPLSEAVFENEERKGSVQCVQFKIDETKNAIIFYASQRYSGMKVDVYVDDHFLFTSTVSKKGVIKIHKNSKLGRTVSEDLDKNRKIEIRA